MWKRSLAAPTLEQIAVMVLCGTTLCRFIILLKNRAAVVRYTFDEKAPRLYIRSMRLAIFFAAILTASASGMADVVSVTSPEDPQTFSYGEVIWHQLYVASAGELAVRITFSNLPYVGDDTPRRDEPFDFRFPGVKFHPAQRAFFVRSRHGELIPVARFG